MPQENKNIQLESNDDLTISPVSAETNLPDSPSAQIPESNLEQNNANLKVVAKPEVEGKPDFFDMRLENLSKNIKKGVKEEKVIKSETRPLHLFIFRRPRSGSFLESFVVTVSFVIFSAIIFAAGVFADISYDEYKKEFIHQGVTLLGDTNVTLKEGDKIDTAGKGGAVVMVNERGLLRLGENTVMVFSSSDDDTKTYSFNLEKGSMWGNTVFDESSFVVEMGYSKIYADDASFSVVLDDLKTTIYSDVHDVKVDLLADGNVINKLWIAQGNQAQILHSKIDTDKEKIEKLLYSKLVKEFGYGRIAEKKKTEDPWLIYQLEQDISYYNTFQKKYADGVEKRGLKTVSIGSLRSQAKSILADMQSALTFSENKKNIKIIENVFENIHDAEYLFLQGNEVDGNVRLSMFSSDLQAVLLSADDDFKRDIFGKIKQKYYELSLFVPGDDLFPIKQLMFEKMDDATMSQFLDVEEKFTLLTAKMNDVYDAVKSNPMELGRLFSEYFELYEKYTKSYSDKMSEIGEHVIHQNILVDNLLFQTPELYKLEFFDSKKAMEADYLSALTSSLDKREQRQTFISNDIDLLSRIRYFLFNEKLDPIDARQIVYRLIKDIEDYQEGTVDIAAVNELFSKRLSDFGIFWEYLQATEYSSTQLHGASHSERFEAFKKIQSEVLTFEDIKNEILGSGEVSAESVETIINKSREDLEFAGIQDIEFGSYTDASKTRIPIISARVGGIEFRATYDWDRQLVSNIIVGTTVISQDGVKLAKVKRFITETMASLTRAEEKTVTVPSETVQVDELANVKRVASVFLAEKFSKLGVVITMDNIEIVDINTGDYRINNVYFSDQKSAVFSFEYNTSSDKVSNLTVKTKVGDKNVGDTFSSMFMKNLVLKIYEESI